MEMAIISRTWGKTEYRSSPNLPREGDSIDIWHTPSPVVEKVLWWPRQETLDKLGVEPFVNVIIFVN